MDMGSIRHSHFSREVFDLAKTTLLITLIDELPEKVKSIWYRELCMSLIRVAKIDFQVDVHTMRCSGISSFAKLPSMKS